MAENRDARRGFRAMWILACALLLAVGGRGQSTPEGREFHQSYDLTPRGVVTVANTSGAIRVTSWAESRVQVDAVKRGRQEEFEQVRVQVTATRDRVEIQTIVPRGRNLNVSVEYELKVPRTAILDPITTSSGEIVLVGPLERVNASTRSGNLSAAEIADAATLSTRSGNVAARGVRGELRAESFSGEVIVERAGGRASAISRSGSVRATDIRDDLTASAQSGNLHLEKIGGRVIARSLSGGIVIREVGGDVQAETLSDSVTVTDARGRVNAHSVSGNVVLRAIGQGARAVSVSGTVDLTDIKGRIEAGTTSGAVRLTNIDSPEVSAKAVSGDVRFAGKLQADGHYEFESFSSNVILLLPADSEFSISARTHSGSINTEFPVTMEPSAAPAPAPNRSALTGAVGKGGAVIRASTFSGSVYLKKSPAQGR